MDQTAKGIERDCRGPLASRVIGRRFNFDPLQRLCHHSGNTLWVNPSCHFERSEKS